MNSDRFGGQSHLILPVVLASVALLAIGFAVAALVGTGASAAATPSTGTLTYVQTEVHTVNGKAVTVKTPAKIKFKTKRIPASTVTRNGSVITLPAHVVRVAEVTTLPGKVTTHRVTTPGRTTTRTNTVTNTSTVVNTVTNTSTIFSTVTQTDTVTLPGTTITITVPTT